MKFKSVSTKVNIAITAVSVLSLIIGAFVLFGYAKHITNNVYANTKTQLIANAQDKIAFKMKIGITNAISIANDSRIATALKKNKRKLAINSLKDISQKMKKYTDFKNIKIHIHTKENKSFLRNWKLEKFGDDLSSFRYSIVYVNRTLRPITTFEAGRAGLRIRAIIPLVDNKAEHLGSLEFIQGINSVVKDLEKADQDLLLLMGGNIQKEIKTSKDFSFVKAKKFQNYLISQKYLNQDFLSNARNIDMNKLFSNGYILGSKYFYTYADIKDFQNKKLGIILLGKPLSLVNAAINEANNLIYMTLLGILSMTLVIGLVIIYSLKKLVIRPLKVFENGLLDFFLFLQGKKDYTESLDINSDDEFGVMAKFLQENITVSARLHEEINVLNTNLEGKVEEKTKKITTLLDNAGQGFLTFSCDLIIDEEYSKECIKLLGDNLAGKYIPDILFKDSHKQDFFQKTILEACRIDSDLIQKTILTLLPSEIILNKRALKLSYKILENKQLMLIITNNTSQKKLERKIKKEQDVLKMTVEIIGESDSFYDTKKEYEDFINNYKNHIHSSKTSLQNMSEIYRTIHTFKGAFSQLYMSDIVKFLHALENKLSIMIREANHTNDNLLNLLDENDFNVSLQKELLIIKKVLGEEFLNSENFLKIECSYISKLQKKIRTVFKEEELNSKASKEILNQITNLSNQKLLNLLKPYANLVRQLAQRLEKELYEVYIVGDENIVITDNYKPFLKSLIHLFRNSIDHGIESPEERLKHDKDERGTISCSFSKDDNNIQIVISDDGAGIDKEKVLEKAIVEDIVTQEQADLMSEEEIYRLIFNAQFTTKDEVSDISGRGVGLNAVQVELEKLDGVIEIKSQKNIGTIFTINLPYNKGEEK